MLHKAHYLTISGEEGVEKRLRAAAILVAIGAGAVCLRLFSLMVLQHGFYADLAAGRHEVYARLFPARGGIYVQDSRTKEEYPLAINRDYFVLFADTRQIKDDQTANDVAGKLAEVFHYNDEKKLAVYYQLNKRTDPYEPIEQKVDEDTANKVKDLNLPGIDYARQSYRFYPEGNLAGPVVGFLGKTDDGQNIGRYGIEGYWQKELAGSAGFFEGMKSAAGFWLPLAGRSFQPAVDGADMLLTIDRTLQYKTCERLRSAMAEFGAVSASLIIMDPKTGAVRAMCSLPDFDPNTYGQAETVEAYNNNTIFGSYEPGSVFKTINMGAALDVGAVTANTYFTDPGQRTDLCQTPINNALNKAYGQQSMSGILENSINTGMVFVAERMGKDKMVEYIKNFGFGMKEGIELDTESSGNINPLFERKGNGIDCYAATASYGQGITVTPLQLVSAYSAVANGGVLLKPYVVEEIRYEDGRVTHFSPKEVRRVMSKKSASILSGMLANVVEKGHSKSAQVAGYYVGGKTGTAEISGKGGYTEETNHTFVGFAPIEDPQFVMLIKFEKPQRAWADSTASPLFGSLADFILKYYQVPPSR